ncbi:MAG: hypothetical protein HY902_15120 [Deltaproteobacteria bacterium]|nr:hypothetical protein [Deltaproteobacteria bacterium]
MTKHDSPDLPLACPMTQQPLLPLAGTVVAELQQLAQILALRNENAGLVAAGFDAALQTADGARAYLVYAGVADLRPGAGVLL